MMNHKDALQKAVMAYFDNGGQMLSDIEAAIIAYLKAMEAVAVPRKVMAAIAEGHPVSCASDTYICVGNPNFKPDDGSDVNLVFTLGEGPLSGLAP